MGSLQPRGFGEVDSKPVAVALIPPGHLDRGVARMFLDEAFIGLSVRSGAGSLRVAKEEDAALDVGEIDTQAGGIGSALDEERDVLAREAGGKGAGALAGGPRI